MICVCGQNRNEFSSIDWIIAPEESISRIGIQQNESMKAGIIEIADRQDEEEKDEDGNNGRNEWQASPSFEAGDPHPQKEEGEEE